MTEFFLYADLTWPEIADLPRDTALVIPLEFQFSRRQLSSALGDPSYVGILPSFPFGWQGSALSIAECFVEPYLSNLVDSLRDDGFTRVYALTPQGTGLALSASRIALHSEGLTSDHSRLSLQ